MANNSTEQEACNVYIVGNKGLNNELLSNFLQQSTNPSFNCSLHTSSSMLPIKKSKDIKNLVLCNCQDKHEYDQPNACGRHISSVSSDCFWACFNIPDNQKLVENALTNGSHGIFLKSDSLATFTTGITAILQGELWFSRTTLSATLSSLVSSNNFQTSHGDDSVGLTKREKEILKQIALGIANEEIADKLNISPLTVKTHVSNIYRKIKAPNRIQAIFWATKNFVHLQD